MKSWKTTTTGIILIASGIAGLFFAYKNKALSEGTVTTGVSSIMGGIGLLFSKDANVTGVGTEAKTLKEIREDQTGLIQSHD